MARRKKVVEPETCEPVTLPGGIRFRASGAPHTGKRTRGPVDAEGSAIIEREIIELPRRVHHRPLPRCPYTGEA